MSKSSAPTPSLASSRRELQTLIGVLEVQAAPVAGPGTALAPITR